MVMTMPFLLPTKCSVACLVQTAVMFLLSRSSGRPGIKNTLFQHIVFQCISNTASPFCLIQAAFKYIKVIKYLCNSHFNFNVPISILSSLNSIITEECIHMDSNHKASSKDRINMIRMQFKINICFRGQASIRSNKAMTIDHIIYYSMLCLVSRLAT